ncbi:MAG: hypothetical protein K6E31_04515 [bacterium]|nr:hypothetical protein [bacterium]
MPKSDAMRLCVRLSMSMGWGRNDILSIPLDELGDWSDALEHESRERK